MALLRTLSDRPPGEATHGAGSAPEGAPVGTDLRMRLRHQLMYLVGFKPWDSGVSPPELVAAVEGPQALPPGRALDLGCGTGTNAIYMARHGWDVTGADLVGRPLRATVAELHKADCARRHSARAFSRPRPAARTRRRHTARMPREVVEGHWRPLRA